MKKTTMRTVAATLAAITLISTMAAPISAAAEELETVMMTDITSGTEETAADGGITAEETGTAPAQTEENTEEKKPEIEAKMITITFDTDGGTEIAPISAEAGTAITAPEAPLKQGVYFKCWSPELPETMPEEDITLTAVYEEFDFSAARQGDYTISFDTDGGSEIAPLTVHSGDTIPALPTPFRADAIFSHWDIELPETMPTQDITLTAVWADTEDPYADDCANTATPEGVAIDLADAGFDTLADLIPGGKILMAPFKSIFHGAVDGDDPLTIMDKKLDKMNTKLDEINTKLDDLNAKTDSNTKWLADNIDAKSDTAKLSGYFEDLAPLVVEFNKDVQAKETNSSLNNQTKILQIAALTDQDNYKQMTRLIFKIKCCMSNENPNVYVSMFDVLYKKASLNKMFSKEAYDSAKLVADDLSCQYIYAVCLMTECQMATQAVGRFTDSDIEALSAKDREVYENFDVYRKSFDNNDVKEAMKACTLGYENFMKYNRPTLIWYGRKDMDLFLKSEELWHDGDETNESRGHTKNVVDEAKKNVLTFNEIKELAEYCRTNYPGKSLMDVFKMMGVDYRKYYYDNAGNPYAIDRKNGTYLVVSEATDTSRKDDGKSWGSQFCGEDFWDHTITVKAINIVDPNCSIVDLKVGSYREEKGYSWFITVCNDKYSYSYPWHMFLYIENK